MKMTRFRKGLLLVVGVLLVLGIFDFSLPPYALQSYVWWAMKRTDFHSADKEFAASGTEKWQDTDLHVAPIFVARNGSRVYFIGSVTRFGRQYDIAYVSGMASAMCKPFLFYSERPLICSLPLGAGWTLHYESPI